MNNKLTEYIFDENYVDGPTLHFSWDGVEEKKYVSDIQRFFKILMGNLAVVVLWGLVLFSFVLFMFSGAELGTYFADDPKHPVGVIGGFISGAILWMCIFFSIITFLGEDEDN